MNSSIYDEAEFFARYLALRENPCSLNEVVEIPTMLALLPNLTGKKLLDLGCGAGRHLQAYLAQDVAFAVGVDLSEKMLSQATTDLAPFAGRVALQQLAMENLSQLAETDFDVITSSFAFHYVEDFPQLLRAIYAKLAPQGYLIFSQEHPVTTAHLSGARWEKDSTKNQTAYRLNNYREEGLRERNWFNKPFKTYHRTTASIINGLIEAGFTIERMEEPMLADSPQWHEEFKDLRHRPPLLFIKARK